MLFVPTLLAFAGLTLCAVVATLVLRGALIAISPTNWGEKWVGASFISFAWHEFGRGLFLGLVAAIGLAPLTIAFFAGSAAFFSNITFVTMLAWGAFAVAIFFVGTASGLIGFLRYEADSPERHSLMNIAQLAVVAVASLPVALFFLTFLLPSLSKVVGLWLDTMSLYAELAS
jgi:hypothetical protein